MLLTLGGSALINIYKKSETQSFGQTMVRCCELAPLSLE